MEKELVLKAQKCNSTEEIMALATEQGVSITEEQAKEFFAKLHPINGELTDAELDNVAGGGCDNSSSEHKKNMESQLFF